MNTDTRRYGVLALAVSALATACGDEDGNPTPEEHRFEFVDSTEVIWDYEANGIRVQMYEIDETDETNMRGLRVYVEDPDGAYMCIGKTGPINPRRDPAIPGNEAHGRKIRRNLVFGMTHYDTLQQDTVSRHTDVDDEIRRIGAEQKLPYAQIEDMLGDRNSQIREAIQDVIQEKLTACTEGFLSTMDSYQSNTSPLTEQLLRDIQSSR